MENISLRSDGFYETPSGMFAVAPRAVSGGNEKTEWFEFKANVLGEVIRVEWPHGDPIIVLEAATARAMLKAGYANAPDADLVAEYNAAVDAHNAALAKNAPPVTPAVTSTGTAASKDAGKDAPASEQGAQPVAPPTNAPVPPAPPPAAPAADASKDAQKAADKEKAK